MIIKRMLRTNKAWIIGISVVIIGALLGLMVCMYFPIFLVSHSNVSEVQLKAILELPKTRYQIGEEIYVEPRLINIGKRPTTIHHGNPLFIIKVYDIKGNIVLIHPEIIVDIGITHVLRPNEPYFFYRVGYERVAGYKFTLEQEGTYAIVAVAVFSIEDCVRIDGVRLYTQFIWMEVSAK